MHLKRIFVFILFIQTGMSVVAQQNTSSVLQRSKRSEEKLTYYKQQFAKYQHSNMDSALLWVEQGLIEFGRNNYKPGKAALLEMLGAAYNSTGSMKKSRDAYQQALAYYKELNDDYGVAIATNGLGVIEGKSGNYSAAARQFIAALKTFEKLSDTDGIVSTYIKLGMINSLTGNGDKSLEYYKKGLALAKGNVRIENVITLNNNIGAYYINENKSHEAKAYFQTALELSTAPELAQLRVLPLINIGNINSQSGNVAQALRYYREAEVIVLKENMPIDKIRLAINIARIIQENDPDSASRYLTMGLITARDMGNKNMEYDVLEALIDLRKQEKKFEEVTNLQDRLIALKDTLYDIEKAKEISNLESIHELEASGKEIRILKAKEEVSRTLQRAFIFIILLFSSILILLAAFTLKTRKLARQVLERKKDLQIANQIKDQLFSVIGHDLRGPMNAIPTLMELYRNTDNSEEEREFILTSIEESAVGAAHTLDNLLNWGKIQIKGIMLQKTEFVPRDVIDGIIKFFYYPIVSKRISIVNKIDSTLVIYADINHFQFILRNLLSNAIKFTPVDGKIELSTEHDHSSEEVVFSVEDTGVGIQKDKMVTIFDPFNESSPGTSNETGNGIGLMLCKQYVKQNGGSIWMQSVVNEGSTFSFSIPNGKRK